MHPKHALCQAELHPDELGPASPSRTGFSPSSGERHAPHRLKRAELGWGGRNRTPGAVRRLINSQVALPTSPTPQQSVRAGLPGQSPRPPIGVVNSVTTHHKPGTPGGTRTLGVRFRGPVPYPSGPRGPDNLVQAWYKGSCRCPRDASRCSPCGHPTCARWKPRRDLNPRPSVS